MFWGSPYKQSCLILVLTIGCVITTASSVWACRFWAGVGKKLPQAFVTEQVLSAPQSLKILGREYQDGWSIGYYENGIPIVFRGIWPSSADIKFDYAVRDVAEVEESIAFAHLRRASSGCVKGVPNPHPFEFQFNGKSWVFGHNGGIPKQLLIGLIGPEFISEHPPQACTGNPPESWIDSELLLIFLMKSIHENNMSVEDGLLAGLQNIYDLTEDEDRFLNFFLSDGETLWAFRKGSTLFFKENGPGRIHQISSDIPDPDESGWKEVPENTLAVLRPQKDIQWIPMPRATVLSSEE